jgi:Flp pilus assembly CpaF family ATPase
MTEKPYGEIMDEMDHEAKYLRADNILQEIIVTMRHARVFITSREKMHPTGVQLYDELLTKLETRVGAVVGHVPHD